MWHDTYKHLADEVLAGRQPPSNVIKYLDYIHELDPIKTLVVLDPHDKRYREDLLDWADTFVKISFMYSLPHIHGNKASDVLINSIFKKDDKINEVLALSVDDQSSAVIRAAFNRGIRVIQHQETFEREMEGAQKLLSRLYEEFHEHYGEAPTKLDIPMDGEWASAFAMISPRFNLKFNFSSTCKAVRLGVG